jgi:thiamine biosynthesis protein ThiS
MEDQFISVSINGEMRSVPPGGSVEDLLASLHISSDRVAVELNRIIVRRRDWAAALVTGGAQIEIVEFVGGG